VISAVLVDTRTTAASATDDETKLILMIGSRTVHLGGKLGGWSISTGKACRRRDGQRRLQSNKAGAIDIEVRIELDGDRGLMP